MTLDWLTLYLGIIGVAVGSFVGLVSVRLPLGEGVVRGRSRCRGCDRILSWPDLIPVGSYVVTRGRCRSCAAPIPIKYPLIELAAGGVGVWSGLAGSTILEAILTALLGWQLLLIALIDLEHFWLPDCLTLPLLATGLAANALIGPHGVLDSVWAAAVGFGVLWSLAFAYRQFTGRDGLGSGDPFLFAGIGAWVGWRDLPAVLLIGCLVGLSSVMAAGLLKRPMTSGTRIAFAPMLAMGALAVWMWRLGAGGPA